MTEVATGRRTLLRAGATGLAFSVAGGGGFVAQSAAAAAARPRTRLRRRRRAYVLVIDGCRPDELDQGLTPRLAALRDGGLAFPRAASLPVMETIPNHVMMMSGVRPDRTGVPANSVYDRAEGDVRTLDRPTDLRGATLLDRLAANGLRTGSVLSKEYLYGIFGTRATYRWEPQPTLPVTEHAPDAFTVQAAIDMVDTFDPHLVFVNLGDIDRFGHSDLTGPLGLKALRRTALADTDLLVGRFVDHLRRTGRWDRSMLLVLADHSMDWSTPDRVVSLARPFAADPLLAGQVQIADNGGADLLYWTGDPARRAEAVARMQAVASTVPGVLATYATTEPSLRLGPEAGDVIAYCQAGWRFSDPTLLANPIPGNHGHPATEPIPFFVTGGHPSLPRGTVSSRRARTVDVAPTVGEFLGLRAPSGGYDGRSRLRRR
ncbi:alkaline phosphatase family protein [Nocardioides sp. YIM 123512]|uniref:Alkaline phosphatase family protein n=1 Tax=Nocardioides flavescens TaxID=2691959 RepID=A0A6L7F3W4_9ACTN|nr:alkaline phosphatase family protein [Nocardioides flavescens]MXG91906.1 alkaline phosphatase family protein [Nocardioides flavescens]